MTDPETNSGADPAAQAARWERKRFKGNKVWLALDSQERPVTDKNKVLIKYQLDQPYQYWVNADNISDLNPNGTKPDSIKTAKKKTPRKPPHSAPAGDARQGRPTQAPDSDAAIIHVYTDGASSGNPGPSGIGVLLQYGSHEREISRYIGTATNNIAELLAVKTALEAIKRTDRPVRLYTDSSYVHGLLTSGWKARKNKALVDEIRGLCRKFSNLELIKVKGHGGNEGNEKADHLATSAIKKNAP